MFILEKVSIFRKHEFIPDVSYHGNCGDITTNWKEEDLSVSANIRIQRPAGRYMIKFSLLAFLP